MITRVLIGCGALCALAFASFAKEPKDVKETKLKPTFVFSGSHSAIDRETFAVVTDETAWKDLWKKHRGDAKTLQFTEHEQDIDINFGEHYVVALFTPGGDSCAVTPRKRGNEVVIGFRALLYGIEGQAPGTKDTKTDYEKAKNTAVAPYVFVVLSKPVKTVVIESDVRRDKFGTPVWEERKRFPAPKDKK